MRNLILIFAIILVGSGCASTPAYKDPNVVYIDEVKVTTTDGKTHVGIFADKTFQYNVTQSSETNQIILDIEDADSTYTILPKIAVTDTVLNSITKEQTFNQMGMPVSRFTINLKSNFPYDAMQTRYGARVEIASMQPMDTIESIATAPPPEEAVPTGVAVPVPPPVAPVPVPLAGPRVVGLDVIEFPEKSQFIITTSEPVQFSQEKIDKKFLMKLDNVSISENLREFIDFGSANYSILSIAPLVMDSSVSFAMALREDVSPVVTQDNLTIYVDVPKSAVAQAPTPQVPTREMKVAAPSTTSSQLISLNVRNAELTDVIAMVSKNSGVNIVAGNEAKGRVTVNLKNIPWDQALMTILRSHQLTYVYEGNSFRVISLRTLEEEKKYGPFEDLVIPLDFANANKIKEEITPFLSPYGKISNDGRTNSLIVRDLIENINRVRVMVAKIDRVEPAVLFDAQFVEASPAFTKQLGIQWAASSDNPFDAIVGSLRGQGDFYSLLETAQSNNLVNIVSNTKITAVANKEFEMKSYRELPFRSKDGGTEFKRYIVGLKGTTKITNDNLILLSLDLRREFPGYKGLFRRDRDAGGQSAKTELRLVNGETTVISWSLPGKSKEPKELMVFLTPRLF